MPDLVNLNKARKSRARAEAKGQAAANRAKFGRTKLEKRSEADQAARLERQLDQSKRET